MVDETVKILKAITDLIAVLIWPVAILYLVIRFRSSWQEFFSSLGEISWKGFGLDISAKRRQTEATASLTAAAAVRPDATPETTAQEARKAAEIVSESVTPRLLRRAQQSRILWVDDKPEGNRNERRALEALGITIAIAKSTEEALDKLTVDSYDLIISDLNRPPDPQAGYTLLDAVRSRNDQTPFIIYSAFRAEKYATEARRRGVLGFTNRANELFQMVLAALRRSANS